MSNSIKTEWRLGIQGLAVAAGIVVFASTLLGLAGPVWWVFDLFSHFQLQYLLGITAVILVLLLVGRRYGMALFFALCAAINLYFILPYYLQVSGAQASGVSSRAFRTLSLNVSMGNEQYELVRQLVRGVNPDIVLLTEVSHAWTRALEELSADYPYGTREPRGDNFGIALYSRLPLNRCEVIELGAAGAPSIIAELEVEGKRVALVGTHPLPPISGQYTNFRNDQILAVSRHLRNTPGPWILLGDLNTSPWSYWFRRLISETGMKDSSLGRGVRCTWPADSLLLRVPIDYCLVSEEIVVRDHKIGPDVGSDHFPLIVDVAVKE
jgi:endonuclease/exonuclease/phosphatase (EEP) superfamily protein YafD